MDVRRHRLDNGLRIAVVPIPGLLSAAVLLAIEAGQWFEPVGRPGIGHLCALAMLRGTTTRDAKTWGDALDAIVGHTLTEMCLRDEEVWVLHEIERGVGACREPCVDERSIKARRTSRRGLSAPGCGTAERDGEG